MRFPPVLIAQVHRAERTTSKSFPHLAGTVFSFDGNERDHHELVDRVRAGQDWTRVPEHDRRRAHARGVLPALPDVLAGTAARRAAADRRDVVLLPARAVARSGAHADVPHARVRPRWASPTTVVAWREHVARARHRAARRSLGSAGERSDVANDPFFGRGGQDARREPARAEAEVRARSCPIIVEREARRRSARSTTTRTTSARLFDIATADGDDGAHARASASASSASSLALFKTHGFDPRRWPAPVRERSGPERDARLWHLDAGDLPPARAAPRATASGRRSNCYVDVWIELLHALGLEPMAMLAFTLAIDFEGDQWTFFKPPHADLERPLRRRRPGAERAGGRSPTHVAEQLARGQARARRGRRVLPARHGGHRLPARSTRRRRSSSRPSTSRRRRLGYFHNAGYYEPRGRRLRRRCSHARAADPRSLPPYAEFVQLRSRRARDAGRARGAVASRCCAQHLRRRAAGEPVSRVRASSSRTISQWLLGAGVGHVSPVRVRDAAPARRGVRAARRCTCAGSSEHGAAGLERARRRSTRSRPTAKTLHPEARARGQRQEAARSSRPMLEAMEASVGPRHGSWRSLVCGAVKRNLGDAVSISSEVRSRRSDRRRLADGEHGAAARRDAAAARRGRADVVAGAGPGYGGERAARRAATTSFRRAARVRRATIWWFRTRFAAPRAAGAARVEAARFEGLATLADVWLNGAALLDSRQHVRRRRAAMSPIAAAGQRAGASASARSTPRWRSSRPRPRWRTRLVEHQQLRLVSHDAARPHARLVAAGARGRAVAAGRLCVRVRSRRVDADVRAAVHEPRGSRRVE